MEALRKGHRQPGATHGALKQGLQFKLADVGGFRFLGMPDAVTHGLDGQSGVDCGRLGRFGRLWRHEQAAVLVEIRLMFELVALFEVQAIVVRAFFKSRCAGKQGLAAAVSQAPHWRQAA